MVRNHEVLARASMEAAGLEVSLLPGHPDFYDEPEYYDAKRVQSP